MKILIKLDKRLYKNAKHHTLTTSEIDEICDVIANGIPLPKGHGRLIDADALNRKDVNCANTPMNFIDTAPTIIEADKGESEE